MPIKNTHTHIHELHTDFRYFNNGVCHVMKVTILAESNPGVQLSTNSLLLPQTVDVVGDNKAAITAMATASDRRKLKRSDTDLQI